MKPYTLIVIVFVALAGSVRAADQIDWGNLESDTVLKAISMFEADPGGKNSAGAMAIIVNFAEASANVLVTIDSGFLPWLTRKPPVKNGEVLLAAFVAGNIRPQLEKQVKQDHPVEGILFMCQVYTALRQKKLIEKLSEPEEWRKLNRDGIAKLIPKIRYKESQQSPAGDVLKAAPEE